MGIEWNLFSHTYIERLHLKRPHSYFKAFLCLSTHSFSDLKEKRIKFLHPIELSYFESLAFERRQKSYLLGRYCAKQAIAAYLNKADMNQFLIKHGVFEQPIVQHSSDKNIQVSISHSDEWGGAIAFPEEHPMAIDLEKIDPDKKKTIRTQCTPKELGLIKSLPTSTIDQFTIIWTVKESLSKVLKCGFMSPFSIFEVQDVKFAEDYWLWTFKNFAQYKAISFIIGEIACSIIMPKRTDVILDIKDMKKQLGYSNPTGKE